MRAPVRWSTTGRRDIGDFIRITGEGEFEANIPLLSQLQSEITEGLEALYADAEWELPRYPERWILQRDPQTGQVRKRYDADTGAAALATAADLIADVWPRMRRCAAPACRAFFVFSDPRQHYCGKPCSDRVRQERHRPKRRRDYKAEHKRRVAKKHPGAKRLKVGRS
jgi:hypothetical protein